ncbi:DUF6615 family protein [Rhizobium leguminosarum]|uniref:Uncharacterized protein n=1 Tax=Rhizobium leguminosarum TaxID=384 RepID=A0A7K3VLG1_RHILE|nr:DUF6615 family protein [Rhizobium leguminosarum]NEK17632.1 hypothetical protein [Rhizobium leguminosarum]
MKAANLDLCQTFLELGDAISRNLELAYGSHISYGEETITEGSLLQLWNRHSAIIAIQTFSKPKEAVNGADWEWHLIGRKYTLKMRVQAKRLAKNGQQIKRLFSQKAKTAPHPQIDMLIADATLQGLLPVYCFYSAEAAKSTWTTATMPPDYQAGCLLGLARDIKAGGSKYLYSIEQVGVPWHFLVCPKLANTSPFPSLSFLNGQGDTGETALKVRERYIVSSEFLDHPEAVLRDGIRELFDLPEDYQPVPVIGRVSIDCRQLE